MFQMGQASQFNFNSVTHEQTSVIPSAFCCPLTRELMLDPVSAPDGITYERSAIEDWISHHGTSPKTGSLLKNEDLRSNVLVKELIDKFIAEKRDTFEEQFFKAMIQGDITALQFLLKLGVNIRTINNEGLTALHFAAIHGHDDVIKFLLNRDLSVNLAVDYFELKGRQQQKTQQLKHLETQLAQDCDWIPKQGTITQQQLRQEYNQLQQVVHQLNQINSQAKYDPENSIEGQTALHLASAHGHVSTVELLINNQANVTAIDLQYRTPLHLAAAEGHVSIMRSLIDNNADINAKDEEGMTPLHLAAINSQRDAIYFLIEKGADHRAVNNSQKTPGQAALNQHAGRKNTSSVPRSISTSKIEDLIKMKVREVKQRQQVDMQQTIKDLQDQVRALTVQVQQLMQRQSTTAETESTIPSIYSSSIISERPTVDREESEEANEDKEQPKQAIQPPSVHTPFVTLPVQPNFPLFTSELGVGGTQISRPISRRTAHKKRNKFFNEFVADKQDREESEINSEARVSTPVFFTPSENVTPSIPSSGATPFIFGVRNNTQMNDEASNISQQPERVGEKDIAVLKHSS